MKTNRVYVLALLLCGVLVSCIEQTPIDIQNAKSVGRIDSLIVPMPVLEKTAGRPINTGTSPLLLLGQVDNKRLGFLIKFIAFPDSSVVEAAELQLINFKTLGDSTGTLRATAHRVIQDWQEDEVTFASFASGFDPEIVGEVTMTPADSDTVIIAIDPALVTAWIDSSVNNYGIYLRVDEGRFAKQFFSSNSSTSPPRLRLRYHRLANPDTTLTTEVPVSSDAFLFEELFPPADGPLYVSDGDDYRTLLKFDFSAIPQQATVNRAILILFVDSTHSFLSEDDGHVIGVFRLTEESQDPVVAPLDSSNAISATAEVVVQSTDRLVFNITSQVQRWTFGLQENFGMLVVSQRPGRDVYRSAFYSSRQDSAKAPQVKVYYTVPSTTQ